MRLNPEIAPENAEIYERLLVGLRDDLGRELTKNVTPPPTDPLTLEQLREMDGEPVWITPAVKGGRIPERWMLMACFLPEDRVYLFMPDGGMVQAYPAMSYGKIWLAYRRKPEEGAI